MAARRARPASGGGKTGAKKTQAPGKTGSPGGREPVADAPPEPVRAVPVPHVDVAAEVPGVKVVEGEVVRAKAKAPRQARKPASEAKAAPEKAVSPKAAVVAAAAEVEPEPAVDPEDVEAVDDVAGVDEVAIVPAKQASVGRRDPLQAYMAEVRRHPLLTREEEIALARRYRDTGDVRAAYTLVASNLRLVVKLAHEYHRNPLALLDLVQEGNIGLMQAVKKFDPERGVKLASYAAWWIRAYVLRYIMDNWKMVKLGTTEAQRKLFFKLRQEQEKLRTQGYEVTPKLLAERLNVTEQDVIEMDQRLGQDELSLDAPLGREDDGKETRVDRMLSTAQPPVDEALGAAELKQLFRDRLKSFSETLSEKEKLVFEKRLIADEPMTLQDIGAQWGVSRERARQIEAALIDRMREYMRTHIPDFDLVRAEEHD